VQKLSIARWLTRAVLVSVLSASFAVAQAQAPTQPAKPVAPPPGDLEPGVNTSAIQPSSEEPAATAPAPTPKPARRSASSTSGAGAAPASATSAASGSANSTGADSRGAASSRASSTNSAAPGAANSAGVAPVAGAPGAAAGGAGAAAGSARATPAPKSGAAPGKAHDRIELDTTQITGNRELPKVLYIVPWKRSDLGDLVGKPVNSLLDEVLTPVDRDVFKRQNRYYDALKPDEAKDSAGAAAGADVKH
jgi:hypothetical protein